MFLFDYSFIITLFQSRYVDLGVEVKYRGQAVIYSGIEVINPKSRPYPRSWLYLEDALLLFLQKLQESSPMAYQNNSLFFEIKRNPLGHLDSTSATYCMEAKANLSKIPYANFNEKLNKSDGPP